MTAIELLIEQLRQLALNPNSHLGMGDIRVTQGHLDELEEQAKQMEKQQIINAVDYGCSNWGSDKDGEEYYNETFNK